MATQLLKYLALLILTSSATSTTVEVRDFRINQQVTITGLVQDMQNNPIRGVQISIEGTTIGATSREDGRYAVSIPESAGLSGQTVSLAAQRIGFARVVKTVELAGDTVAVNFQLTRAKFSLQELRVAGVTESEAGIMYRRVSGAPPPMPAPTGFRHSPDPDYNREAYDAIEENDFLSPRVEPLSTFSIDVDRASYSNVRRFLNEGRLPPKDAVRIEELINYFHYDYPTPAGEHPFSVTTEVSPSPWNQGHHLVRIGLKGYEVETEDLPPSNLVFLLDVSGSMQMYNKLPLLKRSFGLLADQLREEDRVAIVVYAGAAGLVLPSTPGSEKETILASLERLKAGGSTAGGAGIRLAYQVARDNFIEGGNNRVILATDGDFNVGASSNGEMQRLIEEKREEGTFLTVLGFGTGNLQDSKMETLADHGNGNFAYIDNLMEARKVLVSEMGGTLLTIAKDVKLQVEFNPTRVQAYRLIGYENRLMAAQDFDDDTKDAGELGAGHTVTALYEVIPTGVESEFVPDFDPDLRYQESGQVIRDSNGDELLFVKLRYKNPDEDESRLLSHPVPNDPVALRGDMAFAAAVAEFGMLLRDSAYRGNATFDQALRLAEDGLGEDPHGYRSEFLQFIQTAIQISDREPPCEDRGCGR